MHEQSALTFAAAALALVKERGFEWSVAGRSGGEGLEFNFEKCPDPFVQYPVGNFMPTQALPKPTAGGA